MDIHISLIRRGRREYLGVSCRKRRISLHDTGRHSADSLYGEAQRRHVQQKKILSGSCGDQSPALKRASKDRGSLCHTFVRIDIAGRFFPCHLPHLSLDCRYSGRSAHEQDSSELRRTDMRIVQCISHRILCLLDQITDHGFKFLPRDHHIQMQRFTFDLRDKRLHDMRGLAGRKLFLRTFRRLADPLHSRKILRQIYAGLLLKLPHDPLHKTLVKIVAAQMVVSGSGKHFYNALANLDNRYIKCPATKIVNHNLLRLAVIQSVGKSGARRLVDDTLHIQPRDPACIFCRLSLDIVKICRHRDNGFRHLFSEKLLRIFFKLHQDHGADRLRLVLFPVDLRHPVAAHMPFYRCDRPLRIRHRLPCRSLSDQPFSILCKRDDTRRCRRPCRTRYDHRRIIFNYGNTTVGRSQIDPDHSAHFSSSP